MSAAPRARRQARRHRPRRPPRRHGRRARARRRRRAHPAGPLHRRVPARPRVSGRGDLAALLLGEDIGVTSIQPLYARLFAKAVTLTPHTDLVAVEGSTVVVANTYTGRGTSGRHTPWSSRWAAARPTRCTGRSVGGSGASTRSAIASPREASTTRSSRAPAWPARSSGAPPEPILLAAPRRVRSRPKKVFHWRPKSHSMPPGTRHWR